MKQAEQNPIPLSECTIDNHLVIMPESEINKLEKMDYTRPILVGPSSIAECAIYRKKDDGNSNNVLLIEIPQELYDGCGEKIKLFLVKDGYGHHTRPGIYC